MTRPPALTWNQVWSRRLVRHGLAAPVAADRLTEQIGTICGAHAQVMSAAEVSIGIRASGITRADVRRALWEERSLVKTVGPRGTVHLLPTADLAMWNAVLDAALQSPGFAPDVGLDDAQTDAVVAAIGEALTDRDLTLEELDVEVPIRAGQWAGERVMPAFQDLWPRWRQAIRPAATRGVLCFGPNRGRRVTYSSPRRWVAGYEPSDRERATVAALSRYLHAYGPARPEHFARWIGSSPAWARDAFAQADDSLGRVEVEGEALSQLAGDEVPATEPAGVVRLLPYFDAYGVGSYPRERLFVGRAADRALARGQAGNYPILLIDGLVEGVWHQKRAGKKLAVTVEPFRKLLPTEHRDLEAQVEHIGRIQEATATFTLGTVTAGPHA
jgi:hypothetical protein